MSFGFRIEDRHLNPRGLAHGGALATFADMQLAALMRMGRLEMKVSPTISLSLDYLAPARVGDWVEGEVSLVKRTGRLAFTETILRVEGEPVGAQPRHLRPSREARAVRRPRPAAAGAGGGAAAARASSRSTPVPVSAPISAPCISTSSAAASVSASRRGTSTCSASATAAPWRCWRITSSCRCAAPNSCTGPFAPTLSLSLDYLGPARLGDWVEAEATLARVTGRYVFTQAMLSSAEGPVARSSAIYALTRG